jgi:hypothetical protein
MVPNDVPPWPVVQQQTQRWIKAGCFERLAHDLREVLRVAAGREAQPTAVILASRTVQSDAQQRGAGRFTTARRCSRRGHLGACAGAAGDSRQRAGPGTSRRPRGGGSGGDRRKRPIGLRRSGLHRPDGGPSGRRPRAQARGHQTLPGQARLRPPAQTLARRTILRLGGSLPPPRPRLRMPRLFPRWSPRARLRLPQAPQLPRRKFTTASSGNPTVGRRELAVRATAGCYCHSPLVSPVAICAPSIDGAHASQLPWRDLTITSRGKAGGSSYTRLIDFYSRFGSAAEGSSLIIKWTSITTHSWRRRVAGRKN